MLKRLLTLCLVILLSAVVAGCAAQEPSPTPATETTATPPTRVPTETLQTDHSASPAPTPTPAVVVSPEPFVIPSVSHGGAADYMLMNNTWVYYDYVQSKLCAIELDAQEGEQPRHLKSGSNWFIPWGDDILYFGSYAQTARGFITNPRTGESRMVDKKHSEFYIPFYTQGEYIYFSQDSKEYSEVQTMHIMRMHKHTLETEFMYTVNGSVQGVCGNQLITTDLRNIYTYDFETGENKKTLFEVPENAHTNSVVKIVDRGDFAAPAHL